MKRIISTLCIATLFSLALDGKAQSTKERLESIVQTEEIASFFDGIFENLGITVKETGEELTLRHTGDLITIEEGLDESEVDYVLPLELKNIEHIGEFSKDGAFTEVEATHIASVFFTPFTKATLKNEVLSENRKRRAAGIEDVIHVSLTFPDGEIADQHTLIYVPGQWIVIEGLIGIPQRTFTIGQGPALEYQRRINEAIKLDTKKGWLNYLKWYREWRGDYSVKH